MASAFYFVGLLFAAAAAFFGYRAEMMDVSINGMANAQLMHLQTSILNVGIGAGIIAAIFIIGGGIVQTLSNRS